MTLTEEIITIALCVVATMLTRFIPFLLFRASRPTPPIVRYLGNALPAAVFALLVVYCLRSVPVLSGTHGAPEGIAIAVTVLLHLAWRQMLISIAAGTICYMALVQLVFV